ncbi:MAG: DUF58 domain-containing protein [Armatimonadota bacterium]|nr:DUF58 domain-containing protein [Armatimonadota bacterium]MDR7532765.1 DUF58 domain-containing protein [Armatimonadota bacterium]MDR7537087.1 DUF58 domain-containing protein [Armatimonadota bacterium]
MPTREGTVLLTVAAAIFLLATNVMSGLLFVLDAVVLATVVAGTASALTATRRVRARRQVGARGVEGTPLPITLTLEVRRPARLLAVEDGWPGARAAAFVPGVRPDRPEVVTLAPVPARRGRHRLGPLEICSRGSLGVFAARRQLGETTEVLVWPALRPVAPAAVERLAPVLETAATARRTRHAEDLYGVRDYRAGDNLAHVHWRSSARRGALVVREFERPEAPGVAVVLDLDRRLPPEALDPAVRAAASLYRLALDRGLDAVLMAWAEGPVVLRPWEDAMDWLASVRPSGPPLPEALARLRVVTDRHLLVVALTDGTAGWPDGSTPVLPAGPGRGTAHHGRGAAGAMPARNNWDMVQPGVTPPGTVPAAGALVYATDGTVLG